MSKYMFADEAGNFDFSRKVGASRYFILCTVTLSNCDIGPKLLELRRQMVRDGLSVEGALHASKDAQAVRDRVFDLIALSSLRIDATILDKTKAEPKVRTTDDRFYKIGWFYHFKYIAPRLGLGAGEELFITAASVGTAKKRRIFRDAVDDVVQQVLDTKQTYRLAFWDSASDPCLQLADYCCWAIQRKWEMGDDRSYTIIEQFIGTQYELFKTGTTTYY